MKAVARYYQWAGEKAGSYEPTKLDQDFVDTCKTTEDTDKTLKKIIIAAEEYLQPNPSTRAKMKAKSASSKGSNYEYQQPEEILAQEMIQGATTLGEDSVLAVALNVAGPALTSVAQCRSQLDADAMDSFIGPLQNFRSTNIKEVKTQKKRLESRRLEYDAKGRYKDTTVKAKEDFLEARIKFEEQKKITKAGMLNLQDFEEEHCGQLLSFLKAQYDYHQAAASVLGPAIDDLKERVANAPPRKAKPSYSAPNYNPAYTEVDNHISTSDFVGGAEDLNIDGLEIGGKTYVMALYDFVGESDRELDLTKGDKIELLEILDQSWMEGRLGNKIGVFPIGYVTYC
eukprot:CFRG6653T1